MPKCKPLSHPCPEWWMVIKLESTKIELLTPSCALSVMICCPLLVKRLPELPDWISCIFLIKQLCSLVLLMFSLVVVTHLLAIISLEYLTAL